MKTIKDIKHWTCILLPLFLFICITVFMLLSPFNAFSAEHDARLNAESIILTEKKANPDKTTSEKNTEDELFNNDDTITSSEKVKDDTISNSVEKKSLNFNGFLNSRISGNYLRGTILREIGILNYNNFMAYFQGNFSLDARLIKGIKGYVNASAEYYPTGMPKSRTFQVPLMYLGVPALFSKTDILVSEKINSAFSINEIFVDINFDKRVYFRIGKQTLRWGTGYLWTPTDLINIEKTNILDSSQVKQGSYGLKVHVPFGTRANIYSFIDLNNAKRFIDIGMANKVEVLFKNTEIAFSVLVKKKNVPVYGLDFTTRLLGLDVHGEASLSFGENNRKLHVHPWYLTLGSSVLPSVYLPMIPTNTSLIDYKIKGKWIPKASFGFGRGFEVKDVKDRIRIDIEGFYNHTGYNRNVFEKDIVTVGTFLSRGLYVPNYYGKYYVGAFITIRQMFVEELSSMVNCIVNVGDQSSVISGMLTYSPIYDLTLNLMVNGYVGKRNREYTVFGNYVTGEFSVKIVF